MILCFIAFVSCCLYVVVHLRYNVFVFLGFCVLKEFE